MRRQNVNALCYVGRLQTDESIMWYPPQVTSDQFQDKSFIPVFSPVFLSDDDLQNATKLCGEDKNCLLDFALTGNIQVALATKAVNANTKAMEAVLGKK